MLALMALGGPWLVGVLYDPRYASAGAMMVLIALSLVPQAIGLSYDRAALAAGDSRSVFVYQALRGVLQIVMLYLGFVAFGLIGGLLAIGVALIVSYPVLVRLALRHGAWDALHDAVFWMAGLALTALALEIHWPQITALAGH